jgi:putative Mg2+ transporter-C (MgtC) family protein
MISFQTEVYRLMLALVLGALVGLEREAGARAAGVRTHALVAVGSCLVMIVSAFGFADILGTRAVVLDPSRIAAQVVSGIGFLGAGAILFRKEIAQGLNTAASIWVVAAIGLACGGGLLLEASIVTLFTVGVQIVLRPVHMHFHRTTALHVLHIEASLTEEVLLPRLSEVFRQASVIIEQIDMETRPGSKSIVIECRTREIVQLARVVRTLQAIPGVQTVRLTLSREELAEFALPSASQEKGSLP